MTCISKLKWMVMLILGMMLMSCAIKQRTELSGAEVALATNFTATGGEWRTPTQLDLVYQQALGTKHYRYVFAAEGMIKLEVLDALTGAAQGELLLVNGHTLLTRGLTAITGDHLELLDEALLDQQITTAVLQHAFMRGPDAVATQQNIALADAGQLISAETTNTARHFYPPWNLRGTLKRIDQESIAFDLTVIARISSAAERDSRYTLKGTWRRMQVAPRFADDFPLADWRVFRIRPGTRNVGDLTIVSYVSTPAARRYQTLGELRIAP